MKTFSAEAFSEWSSKIYSGVGGDSKQQTWDLTNRSRISEHLPDALKQLWKKGFVVNQAPVWSNGELDGNEIVIVSLATCSEVVINNPPTGISVWRFPDSEKDRIFTDQNTNGVLVATMLDGICTQTADYFLSQCLNIPAWLISYAVPADFIRMVRIEICPSVEFQAGVLEPEIHLVRNM